MRDMQIMVNDEAVFVLFLKLDMGLQALVVQTLDSAIHRMKIYPVDNAIGFPSTYPLDSDLSGG